MMAFTSNHLLGGTLAFMVIALMMAFVSGVSQGWLHKIAAVCMGISVVVIALMWFEFFSNGVKVL